MSIQFNYTVIHILDLSLQVPVISCDTIHLDDDTEAFITKHIFSLWEHESLSPAKFLEESDILSYLRLNLSFKELAAHLADKFYRYMTEYTTIPSGDLLITRLTRNSEEFLVVIKFNYKEAFTHYIDQTDAGPKNKIIKHKSIISSQKITEAFIVNLKDYSLNLLDVSKEKYLSLLLQCSFSSSTKDKIKIMEQTTKEVIEEHYENTVEALATLKSNVSNCIFETNVIDVAQIIEDTFGNDEVVYMECMNKIEEAGLKDEVIEITKPSTAKKYTMHKLKTNTGIELKFPTNLYQNTDFIEFITNPDGSTSILIKNITQIINK